MSTDVKTLRLLMSPSDDKDKSLIDELVNDFTSMEGARAAWEAERRETLMFLDATDTRTTTNSKLPFKNSTTIPKLAQLHQNMVTAYLEHLMPNRDWIDFDGNTNAEMDVKKRKSITSYVRGKAEESNLEGVIERLAEDFTDSGVAVVHTQHVKRSKVTAAGQVLPLYTGTLSTRLNPVDVFWDVTATDIPSARKCVRAIYTVGSLYKEINEATKPLMSMEQFNELLEYRKTMREALDGSYSGRRKFESLEKQGFGSMINYIQEGVIEVLRFFGDFYNYETNEFMMNHEIVVVDRKFLGRAESLDTWDNSQNLHISVWDFRKDSIAPIGPLARIVGMQYKIDKRENLKEDLFDRFASPPLKKVGDVREKGVRGGPNHEFIVEEGGDVGYLLPPSEVLRGDDQLFSMMALMEDLSGAPKEAIGQRTAGEKTKFEVQLLDQGQGKLFRRKVKKFERELVTPILNDILEQGRHHLDGVDMSKSFNEELGTTEFLEVTASDLTANGRVIARGSSLFAEKANALQNLERIVQGPLGQVIGPHLSRNKLFRAVESLGDIEKFDLFTFGIGLQEDQALQRMMQPAQRKTEETALTEEEVGGPTGND